jgi:ribosomal protein S12 methylthiotransferase
VYLNDFGPFEALTPGRFYRCEVTEAHDYDLVARVVGETSASGRDVETVELAGAGVGL